MVLDLDRLHRDGNRLQSGRRLRLHLEAGGARAAAGGRGGGRGGGARRLVARPALEEELALALAELRAAALLLRLGVLARLTLQALLLVHILGDELVELRWRLPFTAAAAATAPAASATLLG